MRSFAQAAALVVAFSGVTFSALAQTQVVVPVPYVSGGIGVDEREALLQEAKTEGYNLKVVTAATGGAYIANISVRVSDGKGQQVLEGAMDGPWLFAKLPSGQYIVTASDGVQSQKRTVQLSDRGMREVIFRWKRAEPAPQTEIR